MGVISKLDAVNHMLLMAGESPVSDLESLGGVDTGVCEDVLERVLVDFQSRGLANNQYTKKFSLTTAGEISVGNNIISAELVSSHVNDDGFYIIGVGRTVDDSTGVTKLWNVTDQTIEWEASTDYYIEIVVKVVWNEMDTPIQRAIMSSAARQYQVIMQGDIQADRYLQELEMMYTIRGKGADVDNKRRSIFNSGTPKLRDIHNRGSSANDPSRFRYWRTSNG